MRLLLFAIISLTFLSLSQASTQQLRVQKENWVQAGAVTLEDVSTPSGIKNEIWQKLKRIKIGFAPSYPNKSEITRAQVLAHLKENIEGSEKSEIQFEIPNKIILHGRGVYVGHKEISSFLQNELKQTCDGCEFIIDDIKTNIVKNYAPGTSWSLIGDYLKINGPFSLPIEIQEPGQSKVSDWVSGRVRTRKKVPVATTTIQINEKLSEDKFKFEFRDITNAIDSTASEQEIRGSLARMAVLQGQIIYKQNIVREKVVGYGESVTAVIGNKDWKISLRAVAQQNGFVGDTIKIQNPESKKILSAVVLEKGLVEVR